MTADKNFKKILRVLFFIVLIYSSACASTSADNDKTKNTGTPLFTDSGSGNFIQTNDIEIKKEDIVKYKDLLVDPKSYSTNGGYYQNKYEKLIISMAGNIVEGQDLDVSRGSIGFYFDKKSGRVDRLFLGVDINVVKEGKHDYGKFSVKLIKENVSGIVDLMYRYKLILEENEIVGIVIGFKWVNSGTGEQVNIWIKKEDLHLFYEGKITLNEMYQRSTITNSTGKIILLPI